MRQEAIKREEEERLAAAIELERKVIKRGKAIIDLFSAAADLRKIQPNGGSWH